MPRNKKYWSQRFGQLTSVEYHHHFDLRPISDLDDEGLAYLLSPVKGINMLDLNETEITNASIKLISNLEYVHELRIKGCTDIDNDCIDDLNKIVGLTILHVKNTGITIDGLLRLKGQQHLKKILFSVDDTELIQEKLLQLRTMYPYCDFIINGTIYQTDMISYFNFIFRDKQLKYKLKIKNEPLVNFWSNWITLPSQHYYETENQGPYPIKDIEWVEIDPIEKRQLGKLIDARSTNHSTEITSWLKQQLAYSMEIDGLIRIYL